MRSDRSMLCCSTASATADRVHVRISLRASLYNRVDAPDASGEYLDQVNPFLVPRWWCCYQRVDVDVHATRIASNAVARPVPVPTLRTQVHRSSREHDDSDTSERTSESEQGRTEERANPVKTSKIARHLALLLELPNAIALFDDSHPLAHNALSTTNAGCRCCCVALAAVERRSRRSSERRQARTRSRSRRSASARHHELLLMARTSATGRARATAARVRRQRHGGWRRRPRV